jgi:7-keto-8-aminopelargonate synthetase-like enzyme
MAIKTHLSFHLCFAFVPKYRKLFQLFRLIDLKWIIFRAVIRLAYKKGIGFIGAGFPATSLTSGRVRFCISASHTKEMLDKSLEVIDEIGDRLEIKYSSRPRNTTQINY